MIKRIAVGAMLSAGLTSGASGQSASAWYPGASTEYHVKACWYDLRTFNGGLSRIGMTFVENPAVVFLYYFSPTDAVQLQKASAIYASLLTASSNGANVYVWVSGADSVTTTNWDFISVQLGPN
jgi:hypothetical protein